MWSQSTCTNCQVDFVAVVGDQGVGGAVMKNNLCFEWLVSLKRRRRSRLSLAWERSFVDIGKEAGGGTGSDHSVLPPLLGRVRLT